MKSINNLITIECFFERFKQDYIDMLHPIYIATYLWICL